MDMDSRTHATTDDRLPTRSPESFEQNRSVASKVLAWSGPLACVAGLLAYRMWNVLPWIRFAELLELILASAVAAALLHKVRGWHWANGLAVFWGLLAVFFVGAAPTAAIMLLAGVAYAIGSLFTTRQDLAGVLVAFPIGFTLIAGSLGWLLSLPIHHRFVYLIAVAAIGVWRWRALLAAASMLLRGWRDAVSGAPPHAAVAMMMIGAALTAAWLPTMQSDDLAYHLGLPAQLLHHGFYAPNPAQQIWSYAPWLGDIVQALAEVIAGREARGAVDALWLLLAAATLGRVTAAMCADVRMGWQVAAAFASLPMVAGLVAGMQTELPATVFVAAFALLILRSSDYGRGKVFAGAVLIGGLFGLKFGQAVTAIVMLIWASVYVHGRIPIKRVIAAVPLFLFVAGSSYFYAWHASGNPMLPLFNNLFQSPIMAAQQLNDPRWHAGFSALLPWSITFETPRYADGDPGGFGFALVALLGVWLLALWRRDTRAYACMASAVLLLPLLPMQYARYTFPGLALLLPVSTVVGNAALGVRHYSLIVYALCALNLAFQSNGPWPLPTVARKRLLTNLGDADVVLQRFAPERTLIEELRKRDPSESIVLSLDRQAPFVAELAGRGRSVSWYAPSLDAAAISADADPSGASWLRLIDATDATWLLLRSDRLNDAQRAALTMSSAERVRAIDDAELWRWKTSSPRQPTP